MFMILTSNGTPVLKPDATTSQSKQATSNYTKQMYMILTSNGTTVIKTDATTSQIAQAASNNTNEGMITHDKNVSSYRFK